MAESKVYVSQYSGDQLDAAIAALGALESKFASKKDFENFKSQFTVLMNKFIDAANKTLIYEEIE